MSEDGVAQSITLIHWPSLHTLPNHVLPSASKFLLSLSPLSERRCWLAFPYCCITYPDRRTNERPSRKLAVSLFFTRKWASSTYLWSLSSPSRFFWPRLRGIKLLPPRIDVSRCKFVLFFTTRTTHLSRRRLPAANKGFLSFSLSLYLSFLLFLLFLFCPPTGNSSSTASYVRINRSTRVAPSFSVFTNSG